MNYETFVLELIKPLVQKPEEVKVKTLSDDGDVLSIQVLVHEDDLGRVIGRKGRVANAIRTVVYACSARNGKKVEITIDKFDE